MSDNKCDSPELKASQLLSISAGPFDEACVKVIEMEKQIIILKRDYEVMYKLQQDGEKQNGILRATNKLLDEMVSEKGIDKLQAKIDALMLEYCPNEMTKEQTDNWEKHQKSVN